MSSFKPLANSEGSVIIILCLHHKVEEKTVKVNYSGHRTSELAELGFEPRQIYPKSCTLNHCSTCIQENSCMC